MTGLAKTCGQLADGLVAFLVINVALLELSKDCENFARNTEAGLQIALK